MSQPKTYKYEHLSFPSQQNDVSIELEKDKEMQKEPDQMNENQKIGICKTHVKKILLLLLFIVVSIIALILYYSYQVFKDDAKDNDNIYNNIINDDIKNILLNYKNASTSNKYYSTLVENTLVINYNVHLRNDTSNLVHIEHLLNEYIDLWIENDHECSKKYPNLKPCLIWIIDFFTMGRYLLTNSIPNYKVEPYCPFGVGKGYCVPNGSTNCSNFFNLTCPVFNNISYDPNGDVPVVQWMLYKIRLVTNSTNDYLPLNLAARNPYIKTLTNHSEYFESEADPPSLSSQTIGLHLNGQQIKGPTEADGINVDRANLSTLECGGHVTPPVLNGPMYHYHKLSNCLPYESESGSSDHAPLIAWANDGFGIYGVNDYNNEVPVVDECNGHFGYVPCSLEDYVLGTCKLYEKRKIDYHYHAVNYNYTFETSTFYAYLIGCQGPSKLQCNETYTQYNLSIWCSPGCGYELCIQPNTDSVALANYFENLGASAFLQQYTSNLF